MQKNALVSFLLQVHLQYPTGLGYVIEKRSRDERSTNTTMALSLEGTVPFQFMWSTFSSFVDEQFDGDKSMHDSGSMSVKYFKVG